MTATSQDLITQGQARDRLASLMHIRRRQEDGLLAHELVIEEDGQGYILPQVLPRNGAESDVWSELERPAPSMTFGIADDAVPLRTRALVAAAEDAELGMVPWPVRLPTAGIASIQGTRRFVHTNTIPVGFVGERPFQVGHLGNNRWKCNGGRLTWTGASAGNLDLNEFEGSTQEGWIVIAAAFAVTSASNYQVIQAAIVLTESLDSVPPLRTQSGLDETWSNGLVLYPLAFVKAPQASAPPEIQAVVPPTFAGLFFGTFNPGPPSLL